MIWLEVGIKKVRDCEMLYVDGRCVHNNASDFAYFKQWAGDKGLSFKGKKILMFGLGLGVDMLWMLSKGARFIHCVERVPRIIDLFIERNPAFENDSRLYLEQGDFYVHKYEPGNYELILYTLDDYRLLKGEIEDGS